MSTGVLVVLPPNPPLARPQFHTILVSFSNGRAGDTLSSKTVAFPLTRDMDAL